MGDRTSRTIRTLTGLVVAGLLGAGLAACGSGDDGSNPERTTMSDDGRKTGSGEERHDLEPLTKRFAGLGDPVEATWFSGEVDGGGANVPPTIYWIDAVVTVTPDTMTALVDGNETTAAPEEPEVVDALRSSLPTDLVTTEPAVTLGATGYAVDVWLDVDANQVVLTAEGTGS